MWTGYDMTLYSAAGRRLRQVDAYDSLSCTRTVNEVGAASLALPYDRALYDALTRDAVLDVWRAVGSRPPSRVMETVWLLSGREKSIDESGKMLMTFSFVDTVDVLRRFLVAYEDGTAQADKTGVAETLAKAFVTEQIVTRCGKPLSVESDAARGAASVSVAASWQDVLSVVQGITRSSSQQGSYLALDVVADTISGYTFRVYSGQRGRDRSASSPVQLVLGLANGALSVGTYSEDYSSSVSTQYCGGQTVDGTQVTATAVNDAVENLGPWSHTEAYTSAQNSADSAVVTSEAYAALRAARPEVGMSGVTLTQSDRFVFGRDVGFGDRVVVDFDGLLDAHVSSATLAVDGGTGTETVTVNLSEVGV